MSISPMSKLVEAAMRTYARVTPTERGGYRLARFARRFRSSDTRRDTFTTPHGLTLDLDLNCYPDCTMAFGLYELDTARVMRRLLRPGDHFVDGGANIGYLTMIGAQCVGPSGRVDAFEPQPDNRARLEANLRRNGLTDRVRVHAEALSDVAGTATIHRFAGDEGNHGTASLFAGEGASATVSVEVPTLRLDDALSGTSPALIKLDVEGAESLVIKGMTGLLKAPRPPAVILEHNPETLRRAGAASGWSEPVRLLLATRDDWQVRVIAFGLPRIDPNDGPRWQRLRQVNLLVQSPSRAAPMLR
jgi:FkbM family methyltransferase